MLQVAHVLALDLVGPGRDGEARGRLGFGGGVGLMVSAVVDDNPKALLELLQACDNRRIVQVVADDADESGFVGDGGVEHFENRAAGFEAHPLQGFIRLRMAGDEVEAFIGCGGDESIEAVRGGGIAIDGKRVRVPDHVNCTFGQRLERADGLAFAVRPRVGDSCQE